MGADWMGPDDGDNEDDEGTGARPAGMRPAGMRPAGMRPAGMRPAGMRPAGMRPAGMRPAGMRPAGMRPAGMRPAGMRPAGMRPAGMRPGGPPDEPPDDWLDPDEWSADLADLVCDRSALIRLGARLVCGDDEINVPVLGGAAPGYLAQPEAMPDDAPRLAANVQKPEARVSFRRLRPRDHELAVKVVLPNRIASDVVADPDLVWALKDDLARALVLAADRAFLHGRTGGPGPVGIANTAPLPATRATGPDLLQLVRGMVRDVRAGIVADFRSPGWVLDPRTLGALSTLKTDDGLAGVGAGPAGTLDAGVVRLVVQDGADGGSLLGYPFVVSRAARVEDYGQTRIFFASDWSEAWIGVRSDLVAVDVSTEANFQTDETVIRAVMHHDFAVRRPGGFVYGVAP